MSATTHLNIAVMDRNPHVREFLCRELTGLGHAASALPNAESLLRALCGSRPPQVLVLDPEAAGASLAEVAHALKAQANQVAVVLHMFEDEAPQLTIEGALVVEKRPDMGALKAALENLAAHLDRLSTAAAREGA
ncbi:MAG: hypothetical protein AUJ49_12525 [Desulfovibrionaceae bacterium CG1_02_65_16]|nr:MAG: hypothetical protein AUJ49_12525 [Desulfovibrionaceae bacterium CG1_02_65_16]